jgi:hypothetical protein
VRDLAGIQQVGIAFETAVSTTVIAEGVTGKGNATNVAISE